MPKINPPIAPKPITRFIKLNISLLYLMIMGVIEDLKEYRVIEKDHNEIKGLVKKIVKNVNIRDYGLAKAAALNLINAIDKLKK